MEKLLLEHSQRYPDMEPQDYVKLLYQNEFGCGHFVADKETTEKRLQEELAQHSRFPQSPLFEEIGGGYLRFHLPSQQDCTLSTETIAKMFLESSTHISGDMSHFRQQLSQLKQLCEKGVLPLSLASLETYLTSYLEWGCPMVSHSEVYREQYHPHYRVLTQDYGVYYPVIEKISELLQQKPLVVIAIDGRCASGKSTMTKKIQTLFDSEVISMDDFFLPPQLATQERREEVGGNVDYQRFYQEVVMPLSQGKMPCYGVYSCYEQRMVEQRQITQKPLFIVEGSYSLHPYFGEFYDCSVFLSLSPQLQQSRILQRNGAQMAKMFTDKWIPMEEKYFTQMKIPEKSQIQLQTECL